MLTLIGEVAYGTIGLATAARNTRAFAWTLTRHIPGSEDWFFSAIMGVATGAGWPVWYASRRLLWLGKNANVKIQNSDILDRLAPKKLPPIETIAERHERLRIETEYRVRELQGRKASLT